MQQPIMEVEMGAIIEVEVPQDISQNIGVPAQPEHIVYKFPDRPIEYQNDDHAPGPISLRRVRTTMAEIIDICGRFVGTHDTGFVSKDQLLEYRVYDPETREPLVLPFNGSTNLSGWSRCQVQEFLSQIVSSRAAQAIAIRCLAEFELLMFKTKTRQLFEELNSLATHPNQKIQWRNYEKISREVGKVRRVQERPHQEESDKVAQDAQDLQNSRNEEADDGQGQDEAYLLEYDEANVALPDWEYLNAHLPQNVLNGVQEVPIALAPRMEVYFNYCSHFDFHYWLLHFELPSCKVTPGKWEIQRKGTECERLINRKPATGDMMKGLRPETNDLFITFIFQ
ncbi:hypothetical protein L3Y34_010590 [Caenorhabditis briggsae]|uniref:Uncharacterized protein n=1 Tax=Caenorhabditis briggsae TaxID=6238 RepID=A0AAE8ZK64_CAEBR|nr:hypothetical protein L3Y34_010590 [Caenorhabditis briggsae]